MPEKQITNPNNAFGSSTGPGQVESSFPQTTIDVTVSGSVAVAKHDAVALLWDATNRILTVEPWDTDASGQTVSTGVGVAMDAGAAGKSIRVCVGGFAFVNTTGSTPAKGQVAIGSTTKGVCGAATASASTVLGTALGIYLGAPDGSTNTTAVWVRNM